LSIERRLRKHVDMLAGVIGPRCSIELPGALEAAARYIEDTLEEIGFAPAAQVYSAAGRPVRNIEAVIHGHRHPGRIWILGAHYDSIPDTPGADDNASAVAGLLEVARLLREANRPPRDTLRFVAFVNEEPPFYKGPLMGSTVYAQRCRERGEDIRGMINLEMIGYFRGERRTQAYPFPLNRKPWRWLLPNRGNFIAFVGNFASWRLTWRCRRLFRRSIRFPARWVAAPSRIDGTGMSDHWSFWQQGYPAVMVTDTAFFRNPHYHKESDTPTTLDYASMAKVVAGLAGAVARMTGTQ
jgi:Zn-dependent M28 family amino/carboxypeptidase